MEQQKLLFRISQLLSRFSEQVRILNSNAEFSINIHAENILIDVLNVIFDCELENVNYEENKTYPSIDLRDKNKRNVMFVMIGIMIVILFLYFIGNKYSASINRILKALLIPKE